MNDVIKPRYIIYQYGDSGCYKLIKFKETHESDYIDLEEHEDKVNENKLLNNLCRAKSNIVQIGMCNEWQYFTTFTLDKEKYNRYDLEVFKKDLSQWIRDKRKKYKAEIKFMYIPEMHDDGAWHAHGLFSGIPDDMISEFDENDAQSIKQKYKFRQLKSDGYKNMPEYAKRFGFVSVGIVKSSVATAFYISKYITKSLTQTSMDKKLHLFHASRGLKKATKVMEIYRQSDDLDKGLKYHGDFCSVGIVQRKDWTYALDHSDYSDISTINDLIENYIVEAETEYGEIVQINPFKSHEYTARDNISIGGDAWIW
jgi:hypothetical protein